MIEKLNEKLNGNDPYEMVNNATGDLAKRLQSLIAKYAEDARVFELANQFIEHLHIVFDDERDTAGRALRQKAERLMSVLDEEYSSGDGCAAATPAPTAPTTLTMSRLERVGDAVGQVIGKGAGITTNTTIAGAKVTHKWMKDSAIPATRAGSREFWKGLKATGRSAREAYRNTRAPRPQEDDEVPY